MGLPIGCYSTADEIFGKKYNLQFHTDGQCGTVTCTIPDKGHFVLSKIFGDCTAASLTTEYCAFDNLLPYINIILEYLSYNGRISCFFSFKVAKELIPLRLDQLKQFPIMGLHVQKSNREPTSKYYMISGIFKVPNPYINSYAKWCGEFPKHDHLDVIKINEINKQYNLPTL